MDQIDAAEIKLFTRAANDPLVFTRHYAKQAPKHGRREIGMLTQLS